MTAGQGRATGPALAVVVVTYRSARSVGETLRALSSQLREDDELVVVDNASGDGIAAVVRETAPRATIVELEENRGFAAGCIVGVERSSAPLLLFLNPDAVPAPGCIEALRTAAHERPGWGAWQALVTMDSGRRINSSGGVTHFLGMGWAGSCGDPVGDAPPGLSEVDFASGAALCVRRQTWERVGGFEDRYFMYGEDLDLGLRVWLNGLAVGLVPAARVEHDYDFHKGERKWFLLERNRWWTVLSDYPTGLLVALLPALLAAELTLLAIAARGGWLRAKLRSQAAVLRELPQILERRRAVQERCAVGATEVSEHLSASLDNPNLGDVARMPAVVALQRWYWEAVRVALRLLARPRGR
jgi:N-acetylglucosaminyl-diphospho-decaprenol L-rhamnosyltransferase